MQIKSESEQLESFDVRKQFVLLEAGEVTTDDLSNASRFLTTLIATRLWDKCTPAVKSSLVSSIYPEVRTLCQQTLAGGIEVPHAAMAA